MEAGARPECGAEAGPAPGPTPGGPCGSPRDGFRRKDIALLNQSLRVRDYLGSRYRRSSVRFQPRVQNKVMPCARREERRAVGERATP